MECVITEEGRVLYARVEYLAPWGENGSVAVAFCTEQDGARKRIRECGTSLVTGKVTVVSER